MSVQDPEFGVIIMEFISQKLTLHLINVVEINANNNERDLN